MKYRVAIFFSLVCIQCLIAQPWFKRIDSIKVSIASKNLEYPWAGGFNNPQFSEIDLDLDGTKDLFVFDRTGNKISTFLNKGIAGIASYQFAPQYASKFPSLRDWVLLADYDCDGYEDIWAYSGKGGGIEVYKNISTVASGLKFKMVSSLLYTNYPPKANLYVSPVDIPAIADIDDDGDLDVVTFGVLGSYAEYQQNLSKELYGNCDSLQFQLSSSCWGNFLENPSNNSVVLNQGCKVAPHDPNVKPLHSGSCQFCVDMNGDNVKEVVIGDISATSLTMLVNGGSLSTANMISQQTNFPQNSVPVNLAIFPCGFVCDVDNDGLKDMLVSPNAQNVSENFTSVWWYKNTGSASSTVFTFQQNNFLQDNMIEVGEGAYPVWFDYNADGLKDLLVSNYRYYAATSTTSKIALFKNVGTLTNPKFDLITRDFNNLNQTGIYNMMPTFGDLDNDGDADMMVGDYDGNLYYFTNTAGSGNMVNYTLSVAKYKDNTNTIIDVGLYAAPQLIDVDRDGKLDLIIGNRSGKIWYYKNTGTLSVPVFTKMSAAFGNVNTIKNSVSSITGYSTPFMFEQGGSYKLLVGSESGYVYYYNNIDGNLTGNFTLIDSTYQYIWEGTRIAPYGADINNDGFLDLAVGNYKGGVALFYGQSTNSILEITEDFSFNIYPNPAKDIITINISEMKFGSRNGILNVYDVLGQKVKTIQLNGTVEQIQITDLSNGMYVCEADMLDEKGNHHFSFKKILVKH